MTCTWNKKSFTHTWYGIKVRMLFVCGRKGSASPRVAKASRSAFQVLQAIARVYPVPVPALTHPRKCVHCSSDLEALALWTMARRWVWRIRALAGQQHAQRMNSARRPRARVLQVLTVCRDTRGILGVASWLSDCFWLVSRYGLRSCLVCWVRPQSLSRPMLCGRWLDGEFGVSVLLRDSNMLNEWTLHGGREHVYKSFPGGRDGAGRPRDSRGILGAVSWLSGCFRLVSVVVCARVWSAECVD